MLEAAGRPAYANSRATSYGPDGSRLRWNAPIARGSLGLPSTRHRRMGDARAGLRFHRRPPQKPEIVDILASEADAEPIDPIS